MMNKRLVRIIGGAICLLTLAFCGLLVYDNHLHEKEDWMPPNVMSTYHQNSGYFKIVPKTILISLENGDTNVFTPLLEDPQDIEELTNMSIYWTQADFLKIASALGQLVWNDPMDLKDWSVYYLSFHGNCSDSIGLDRASITYFKIQGNHYTTRLIQIEPYFSWVSWGNGETYPKPILRKWGRIDLLEAKITADDALRIASEDVKRRFQVKEICGALMGLPQDNDHKNWNLKIFLGASDYIVYLVNLDTGDFIR